MAAESAAMAASDASMATSAFRWSMYCPMVAEASSAAERQACRNG